MLTGRVLEKLRREMGTFTVRRVDILAHPRTAIREGITMIPTIKAGEEKLSGILLSEEKIMDFVNGIS